MDLPHLAQPNTPLERVRHELRATGIKDAEVNPQRSGIHSRGYLPHVKREGATYFVTFRLADSLPKEALLKFEQEKAERLRHLGEASDATSRPKIPRKKSSATFADRSSGTWTKELGNVISGGQISPN